MKLRQKVGVFLAALIVALGAGAVTAQPAHASASDCYYNHFCMWVSSNWSGTPSWAFYVGPGTGGFCANFPAGYNDNIDSAALVGSYPRSATMYEHANCSGNAVYFFQTSAYGGPWAASCTTSIFDAWPCVIGQTGYWPSSVWILRA